MFVYENGNSLNLTLAGNKPVQSPDTPDVVIKGYKNGASVIVGDSVYGVKSGEEFDCKAKTLVYQKDGKLAITFNGVDGINTPEVTIDEIGNEVYAVVVSGESVTLSIVEGKVIPVAEETKEEEEEINPVVEPVKEEEPKVIPEEEPTEVTEE